MKRFILMVAAAAVAAVMVTATASADVPRHQVPVMTEPVSATFSVFHPRAAFGQWVNTWQHDYQVTINPATGKFSGTGIEFNGQDRDSGSVAEEINGMYNAADNTITFTAFQLSGGQQSYTLSNAPTDTDPFDLVHTGTTTIADTVPVSPWGVVESKVTQPQFDVAMSDLNHGQYVSSRGGGKEAAHSLIGMPLNSNGHN